MLNYLLKIGSLLRGKQKNFRSSENPPPLTGKDILGPGLQHNLELLRGLLGDNPDFIFREFLIGNSLHAALIFLDGMADKTTVNESILQPLMYDSRLVASRHSTANADIETLDKTLLAVGEVIKSSHLSEIVRGCLSGKTILLIDGCSQAVIVNTQGWETRSITEPMTEAVVRGPREGFTENLRSNTTMLRRKIKNPALTLETVTLGRESRTDLCIAYIKGVANPKLIREIRYRLQRIDTDAILESGYIEQFIEDNPYSPFSSVGNSEKPDVVAAKILEGRAAIFTDGSPFVLTVPMLFIEGFQSSEDYYSRPFYASIVRLLRFLAFFISTLSPALYVALSTFHQELIPTALLLTMASAREGVPFPAVVEALIMGVIFEILREAGVRLPRPVGQAISIVGALVIGDAAVSAGLIGAPMVIVVALTAIASFVIPSHTDIQSILRFLILIFASVLGIFGISIAILLIMIHLCSLRSFGAPYLSPLSPLSPGDLKDTFIRAPLWAMSLRPRTIGWKSPRRQKYLLRPRTPPDLEKERDSTS